MKKYLYDYIEKIDKVLEMPYSKKELEKIKEEHLVKISFFQHERLIHLLVTLFYSLFFVIFVALGVLFAGFYIISLFIMIILLFYIVHYFRLENGVQYLYKQYDLLNEKMKQDRASVVIKSIVDIFKSKI